jgi:hypothetical protein
MMNKSVAAFQIMANHAISDPTPQETDMTEVYSAAPNPRVREKGAVFITG